MINRSFNITRNLTNLTGKVSVKCKSKINSAIAIDHRVQIHHVQLGIGFREIGCKEDANVEVKGMDLV